MKFIILAAGRGRRMGALTDEIPKCLLKVKDKSLLDWQLEAAYASGIEDKDIAVVTGYKHELLRDRKLTKFHNHRWAETNMVSSLACASAWLERYTSIVSYSDIFYSPEAIISLKRSTADLAVTYDPDWLQLWQSRFSDPLDDAETFRLDVRGYLTQIGQKPKTVDEIEGQYMGLLRITPRAWKEFVRIRRDMGKEVADSIHMTDTLQKIIDEDNVRVQAIPYKGDWGEVDSSRDLLSYA